MKFKKKKFNIGGTNPANFAALADAFLAFKNKSQLSPEQGNNLTMLGANLGAGVINKMSNNRLAEVEGEQATGQVRNMAADAVSLIPGVGTAVGAGIKIAGAASDAMRKTEEIDGKVYDVTKPGIRNVASNVLDPVGRLTGAVGSVMEGDYKGLVDNFTFGLTNFSKRDEMEIEKARQREKLKKQNEALAQQNLMENQRETARQQQLLSVQNPFGYQYSKKGGLFSKYKKGGWIGEAREKMEKKGTVGTFTSYCKSKGYGKVTSECIAEGKKSSNPTTRKRANFAANVR